MGPYENHERVGMQPVKMAGVAVLAFIFFQSDTIAQLVFPENDTNRLALSVILKFAAIMLGTTTCWPWQSEREAAEAREAADIGRNDGEQARGAPGMGYGGDHTD